MVILIIQTAFYNFPLFCPEDNEKKEKEKEMLMEQRKIIQRRKVFSFHPNQTTSLSLSLSFKLQGDLTSYQFTFHLDGSDSFHLSVFHTLILSLQIPLSLPYVATNGHSYIIFPLYSTQYTDTSPSNLLIYTNILVHLRLLS